MAITAAYIAASGLDAAQSRLDTVAGNIANIKTTAYQKWVTETSDLFYQQLKKFLGRILFQKIFVTRPMKIVHYRSQKIKQ